MKPSFVKRMLISVSLGLVFGLVCIALASSSNPGIWSISSPLFRSILINRFTIGFLVGIIGVYKIHPLLGFRFYPVVRGFFIGTFISLQMALGVLFTPQPNQMMIFWSTIIVGAIYGMIIDIIATYFGGEGKGMLREG